MQKYEAMFILKPDLGQDERKNLFTQISDAVTKNGGSVVSADIWNEKKKLFFPLKRHREGLYYLMNFNIAPGEITKVKHAYNLNEDVLRVLITRVE